MIDELETIKQRKAERTNEIRNKEKHQKDMRDKAKEEGKIVKEIIINIMQKTMPEDITDQNKKILEKFIAHLPDSLYINMPTDKECTHPHVCV